VPVLVAVGFTRAREPSGGAAGGPSVLVVSLDTTRADHVDGLPTFTRLAREGTRWTQAIAAAPITEPSHLAMLTGVAPFRSGVVSNGTDLGDQPALLSRVLSARGWATAAFVAGFPLHSKYGWGQGFQVYDDDFGALPGLEVLTLKKAWNQVAIKEHALRERSADRVLRRAVPWLEAHRDRPFFAFVHFYDPHGPYHSPRNGELGAVPREGEALPLPAYWPAADRTITSAEWLRQAYALEVETVDDAVGRLLAALGNRLDGTVVIVTADHGESLGEHAVWFDHGDDLYDPSLRVPLVVRYPPKVAAGVTRTCQVAGVDVAATVLDLLGVDDGLPRDGRSLAETTCGDRAVVSSTTAGRFVSRPPVDHALRAERRKLILPRERPVELYDLEADPGELRSLAPSAEAESRAAALRALLEQGAGTQAPSMDAETRAMLERLGYLDEN
jgi:arylsulfatase A-like enzyme